MLSVGIPHEVKPSERRIALTPLGTQRLTQAGISIFIEKGAGESSGFGDGEYERAGAKMLPSAKEVYARAGLIKKVKEPFREEWELLKPDTILFCFLHLASPENGELVKALLRRKVSSLGMEAVEKEGRTVLLEPMSSIAGCLSGYYAGFFRNYVRVRGEDILYPECLLEKLTNLAGLFPEIPEHLPPGRGVIFGGGAVGSRAAETLLGMGGEIDLVEKRAEVRDNLQKKWSRFGKRFQAWAPEGEFQRKLREADFWVGCVHQRGERAPQVISMNELEELSGKTPKLILDIAVDQGGNFPGTHSTTYEAPLYLDDYGNLRFGVTNIPSLCGRAASEAIERATLPYTQALAQKGLGAFEAFPELKSGLQTYEGKLVSQAVGEAHHLPWQAFHVRHSD